MYQVRIVENHGAGTLTISGIVRLKRVVDSKNADLLAVELVDTFGVENLEIDLADKKIY